uniref:Lipocalin n=1 Tax=Rhipicephalus appendiculatus TaxID=34631 RepID=A0A131Z8F3_RHIAP
MKLLIASVLLVSHLALCHCQAVPEARSRKDIIDNAKKLLRGPEPLFLVQAVHPTNVLTGNNEYVCWTSTTLKDSSRKFEHTITYYDVTKVGSPVMKQKLGVYTVHMDENLSLQTTNRSTKPRIPGDWKIVEAKEDCMVLGMHVRKDARHHALCLYWVRNSSSIPTRRNCDNAYKNNCENSIYKRYDWMTSCDYSNKPKNKGQ